MGRGVPRRRMSLRISLFRATARVRSQLLHHGDDSVRARGPWESALPSRAFSASEDGDQSSACIRQASFAAWPQGCPGRVVTGAGRLTAWLCADPSAVPWRRPPARRGIISASPGNPPLSQQSDSGVRVGGIDALRSARFVRLDASQGQARTP